MFKSHNGSTFVCAAARVVAMTGFRSDIEIGQVVKDLRTGAGLNQEELAGSAGIDQPTLSRIERGERAITAREVVLFSEMLGVDTDEILREGAVESELLLRGDEQANDAVARCAELFNECIDDYFGLKALLP